MTMISPPSSAVSPPNSATEAELLARLQAQFGDIDVGGMLGDGDADHSDSESSLEEPTPEELRAWQEMQYNKGRMKVEAQKIMAGGAKSALQRRRQNKTTQQRTLMREYEEHEEAREWEHLVPSPDLGGAASFFFPNCDGVDSNLELAGGVNPVLQKLVEADPECLGTKWRSLYSSSKGDGLSFRKLCDTVRGYEGPTILMLGGVPSPSKYLGDMNPDERVSLGFFTTDMWRESAEYFGSSNDCFLFSLDQKANDVQIFRPKTRSQSSPNLGTARYMYFRSPQSKTKGTLRGIGIGGSASQPRLHITESLEECRALAFDQLFEDGDLLLGECGKSLFYFDVDCIEVWGVGGEEWISDALAAQAKFKNVQGSMLEQVRKIDKSQLVDALSDTRHFEHRSQVDGRIEY